jgi:hypothetical protein
MRRAFPILGVLTAVLSYGLYEALSSPTGRHRCAHFLSCAVRLTAFLLPGSTSGFRRLSHSGNVKADILLWLRRKSVWFTVVLDMGPWRAPWGIWWTWDVVSPQSGLWLIYVSYLFLRRFQLGNSADPAGWQFLAR